MNDQLTPHFALTELIASSTAMRLGIDNTPDATVLRNLKTLAAGLELVRALLGHPLRISSGYRSPTLNAAVGGAHDSAHLQGYAADFTCPEFGTPLAIVEAIDTSGIKFDQCIQEGGRWVHISLAPPLRQQTLTAYFNAAGRASYVPGIHQ